VLTTTILLTLQLEAMHLSRPIYILISNPCSLGGHIFASLLHFLSSFRVFFNYILPLIFAIWRTVAALKVSCHLGLLLQLIISNPFLIAHDIWTGQLIELCGASADLLVVLIINYFTVQTYRILMSGRQDNVPLYFHARLPSYGLETLHQRANVLGTAQVLVGDRRNSLLVS